MKKIWLRGLAGILAGLMLLGLAPMVGFAQEAGEEEAAPAGIQQEMEAQLAREAQAQEEETKQATYDAAISTIRSGVGIAILVGMGGYVWYKKHE